MEILKVPGIVQPLLFQALFMENLKLPGKVRKQRILFARHFMKIVK